MINTKQEAYQQGYEAAAKGRNESANPFRTDSDEHLSWNDGYAAWESENGYQDD